MIRWLDRAKALIQDVPVAQRSIRAMRLAIGAVHEEEIKLLPFLVDPTLLAIDVGASLGSYTHALLNLGCRVMSFEAKSKAAHNLQRMYGRKARIIWGAVSSKSGQITLRVPRMGGLATVEPLNDLSGLPAESIDVPCFTLDDAVSEPVGFIKIDVEGHELAVIHGAMTILKRDRPVLLVEAEERHRRNAVQSIRDELTPLGYTGFMLDHGRLIGISQFSTERDQAIPPAITNGGHRPGRYINNFLFIIN